MYVDGNTNIFTVNNSIFEYNTIQYSLETNYDVGVGIIYAFWVPIEFLSNITFAYNYGSALTLVSTHAIFYGTNVTFESNTGDLGGAIALLGSHFLVNDHTKMLFTNNFAHNGGAIYHLITSQGVMKTNLACFVRYQDPHSDRRYWKASFTFINNNSTGSASNSIFSTSVYPCSMRNIKEDISLPESLLFCINHHWKFVGRNCTDEIQTQGNTYQFNNVSMITSFPGQGFELPISVFDDLEHNITLSTGYFSTVATNNGSIAAQVDPKFTLTSNNYLIITGEENYTVPLVLQSSGSRPHHLKMDVKLLKCPPGFYFTIPDTAKGESADSNSSESDSPRHLGKCQCRLTYSFRNKLNCSQQNFKAHIPWNYWIGLDPTGESDNEEELVMSELPNMYSEQDFQDNYYFVLPKSYDVLDDSICGMRNRTGTICGKCKENYSTSVNSYDYSCTLCNDETPFVKNILLFMTFAYLPYVVLLAAVGYFNLKLTSSATSGFILFAQMISLDTFGINGSSQINFDTLRLHKSYLFVYGIFNFNSFANVMTPFCIGKNFLALDVLLLEYTLAVLPLLIMGIIYTLLRLKSLRCLCCRKQRLSIQASLLKIPRSSRRKKKKLKEKRGSSLIHTLVAFFLLSYTKLSVVSMKMLATQKLFDQDGDYRSDTRIFLAGHLSLFSREYLLPYGFIAIFVMVFFVMLPPVLLLGFPNLVNWLLDKEKFKCLRRVWPTLTLHIFLDAFQGFYKPNRRPFAGLYFVFRLIILFVYVSTTNYFTQYILQQVFIVVMIILIATFKPYKREVFNIVDVLIFFNLSLINLISIYVYSSSMSVNGLAKGLSRTLYLLQFCLLWIPLIYMLLYVLFKLSIKVGLHQYITEKWKGRHGEHSEVDRLSYYTNNSDVGETLSHSDDEDRLSNLDSLSDAALFTRAEVANTFRPPLHVQPKRKMESMVCNRRSTDDTPSVGLDTESTTENSY